MINSLITTSAIVSGGPTVTIVGLDFVSDSFFCRFDGGNVVTAHVVSSSQAVCTTPQSRQGIVFFELSHNAHEWERINLYLNRKLVFR